MKRRVFVNQKPARDADESAVRFGAALRQARESRGETQDETACAVGAWQKAISKVERGVSRGIPFTLVLKLADRFGLALQLVPRDEDIARFRAERDARSARAQQLILSPEIKEAYERAIAPKKSRRSA